VNKKKFLLVITILLSLLLMGCEQEKETDGDDELPNVVLQNIIFKDNQTNYQFDLDSFRLNDIKLELIYSDGTKEFVDVTRSMISDSDFKALLTTGQYFIKVNYLDKQLEALIEMSSTSGSFSKLPDVALYALSRTELGKTIYDIYSTGVGNYVSFELVLNHNIDKDKIIMVEVIQGISSHKIETDSIKVMYSFGKPIHGDNHLISIILDETITNELSFNVSQSIFLGFTNKEVFVLPKVGFFIR